MIDLPATSSARQEPETYEIRIQGHLDPRWAARLEVPSLTHESDGTTILRAALADQAALHGLIQRVRDLGLPLNSVIRIDTPLPKWGGPMANPQDEEETP